MMTVLRVTVTTVTMMMVVMCCVMSVMAMMIKVATMRFTMLRPASMAMHAPHV